MPNADLPFLEGPVTVMFTDIEGSTALIEELGEPAWFAAIQDHNARVRELVAAHSGAEVKAQGDGFMIAFPSARKAVRCALDIRGAMRSRLGDVRLRMGLHTGEAIREEADFYGRNVVLAARITDHARGGEILASSIVKQLTESAGDVRFEGERELVLEGLAGRHTVYRVE